MFLQMIEQRTMQLDGMSKLEEEWRAASEGKRTLRRSIIAQDRNDPTRFIVLAFYDDYDAAQANSDLTETADFADRQQAYLIGTPNFTDLDVIKEVVY